ncbi:MAG: glutaconyl-CoA decarboxylase subunit alpha, partial [Syntrophobacterales bacterium]|nr:glutaconyl-CoA decarboxylase subunit alpha [Syntrophobacterales bacterium]
MIPYLKMEEFGRPLRESQVKRMEESAALAEEVMREVDKEVDRIKEVGLPAEKMHERGQMTVWDRIEYVVDPGTFCPLHTIFDPEHEESGSTGVVDGLARINGRWCMLIGFNNKWIAGAWIAGQANNNLRVTDIAKIMNLPLVW